MSKFESPNEPLLANEPPVVGEAIDELQEGEPCCRIGYQAIMFILGFLFPFLWLIAAFTPCCYTMCCESEKKPHMQYELCGCARTYPVLKIDQIFWVANIVAWILAAAGVGIFSGTQAKEAFFS